MNLFVDGEFTSHSGIRLPFKIDCDALTDADIDTIANVISQRFNFSYVYGIPRGGERLASALRKYRIGNTKLTLIVDDVLTTGSSMEEARRQFMRPTQGVVIFA